MNDMLNTPTILVLDEKNNIGSVKDGCYYAAPFMAIELIFISII